jgi:uncharacterized protein YegJ (DUF2314 family)
MFGKLLKKILRPPPISDEFTVVQAGEASIEAATARAKATLDLFWEKFESGAADQYQLKVGLTTPNEAIEHVWIKPIERRDGRVIGLLMSQPVDLEDVSLGDEITIDPERISDWGYFKGGKLYGAFTQRAMLDQISPALRRRFEAALAPNPLEPGSETH